MQRYNMWKYSKYVMFIHRFQATPKIVLIIYVVQKVYLIIFYRILSEGNFQNGIGVN